MHKVEQIKNLFDCDICDKLLIDPIVLPCGNVVCKKHIEINNFICIKCQKEHVIPENGYKVNSRIQKLLDIRLNTLKRSTVFNDCNKLIEQAIENIVKVESLENNSEAYIVEYFEDIKRQVDLRRDSLKLEIDNISNNVIKSIEKTQANLINVSKEVKSPNIDKVKEELDEQMKKINESEFNDNKFKNAKKRLFLINEELQRTRYNYNISLIGNKEHLFEFEKISMEWIFGHFSNYEKNNKINSKIIDSDDLKNKLYEVCEFPLEQELKLVYRATRDGFNSDEFHNRCDGIANTLSVIKSEHGNVFGGFTEKEWRSDNNNNNEWTEDPNAFIISLVNKENEAFKAKNFNNGQDAISCSSSRGPTFGAGVDFYIATDSNANKASLSNFGKSYKHPNFLYGTENAKNILAGSSHFATTEIEVFTKIN